MLKVRSDTFGDIVPDPDASFQAGRANIWAAGPQVYPCFGSAPLPVLLYGKPESDGRFLQLAEEAHRNLRALAPEIISEIAERFLHLCRQYDELTGLTSDMAELRNLPNIPPWVADSIKLADRLALITSPGDIWGFVHPDSVLYGMMPKSEELCARISFRCDWDEEHGIQVVLRSGKDIYAAGPQDGFPL